MYASVGGIYVDVDVGICMLTTVDVDVYVNVYVDAYVDVYVDVYADATLFWLFIPGP